MQVVGRSCCIEVIACCTQEGTMKRTAKLLKAMRSQAWAREALSSHWEEVCCANVWLKSTIPSPWSQQRPPVSQVIACKGMSARMKPSTAPTVTIEAAHPLAANYIRLAYSKFSILGAQPAQTCCRSLSLDSGNHLALDDADTTSIGKLSQLTRLKVGAVVGDEGPSLSPILELPSLMELHIGFHQTPEPLPSLAWKSKSLTSLTVGPALQSFHTWEYQVSAHFLRLPPSLKLEACLHAVAPSQCCPPYLGFYTML